MGGQGKSKGNKVVDLQWFDASGAVNIKRDGAVIEESWSGSTYQDNLGKGGGSFRYQVCNAGSDVCSNEELVVF